jgi:hypothetical protein
MNISVLLLTTILSPNKLIKCSVGVLTPHISNKKLGSHSDNLAVSKNL